MAEKPDSEFSKLISEFDKSLQEQSKMSTIQILGSSAEEMLKSFCGQSAKKEDPSSDTTQNNASPAESSKEEERPGVSQMSATEDTSSSAEGYNAMNSEGL